MTAERTEARPEPTPRASEQTESVSPAAVVVADDDLFFSTRLASRLTQLGYRPVTVQSAEAFLHALAAGASAAILNLASRRFDAIVAIHDAKADPKLHGIPLLGFCGHADRPRQEAARNAGCDLVATNGEASANLPRLLATLLTASGPTA